MEKRNINRHYNSVKYILKERQEWFDYLDDAVKIDQIQKKANLRLFFKMPIFYFLRFIFYLPINLLKSVQKISTVYYLFKVKNEIEVLKDELVNMENDRWIK